MLAAADAAIDKVRVGANYWDDVHMTARNILKEGVVITVEPGIYIPEEGIENAMRETTPSH